MIRRWFIRGAAFTLLILSVIAWMGSYCTEAWAYHDVAGRDRHVGLACGSLWYLDFVWTGSRHWDWDLLPPDPPNSNDLYLDSQYHFAGFAYQPGWFRTYAALPLYFPVLLSGLWHCFLWRKPKPRRLGGAFPVQAASPTIEA